MDVAGSMWLEPCRTAQGTHVLRTSEPGKDAGTSLLEVVAAMAVMLVLLGMLVPVLFAGRDRALEATDLSQLKQLDMARLLYTEDYDGRPSWTTESLVRTGAVPARLLSSPGDPHPEGQANLWRKRRRGGNAALPPTGYKDSYLTVRDMTQALVSEVVESPSGGWLVALTKPIVVADTVLRFEPDSTYHRMAVAGGVLHRRVRWRSEESSSGSAFYPLSLFTDDPMLSGELRP